jgi:hypothetical protein
LPIRLCHIGQFAVSGPLDPRLTYLLVQLLDHPVGQHVEPHVFDFIQTESAFDLATRLEAEAANDVAQL